MRKNLALKTLWRTPLKTTLTFLLLAAGSFTLFSRVTDYATSTRESSKAESFYYGVAALDNSTPPIGHYYPEPKAWPDDTQIQEFSSLPGVTLADTRYTTDGFIEDYKRIIDPEAYYSTSEFVLEGTYDGYEEYDHGGTDDESLYLLFHDIKVHAGELEYRLDMPLKIEAISYGHIYRHSYSRKFFDGLKKGSRYLVVGVYSERSGSALQLGVSVFKEDKVEFLQLIDGLGDDYLETKEFAWYKGVIEAAKQSVLAYDMVYTSDMRAIPYVNERKMVICEGRPLTAEDTDGCVVSEFFLETYGLSLGDRIHVELGDQLLWGQGYDGSRFRLAEDMSKVAASAELEIIGAYRFANEWIDRSNERDWSYGPGTVFVSSALLPIEVPKDHEITMGDFSVLIENPNDIQSFRDAAEPMAAEMSLGLRFSDGGWAAMKNNFKTGLQTSFLTTMLYVIGAALALLLAIYLYIGRKKESYAIMRTLGVPGKKAGILLVLPFCALSVAALPLGGIAGVFYASYTAVKTLANLSDSSAPDGYAYVLDATLPVEAVILCLFCELLFIFFVALLFLQKMKKTAPLKLLQEGAGTAKETGIFRLSFPAPKHMPDIMDTDPVSHGIDITKLSDSFTETCLSDATSNEASHRKYSALRQVSAYILRHMKRGIGKSAVSLILTIALTAGIGMLALARLTYQEASSQLRVKGRAMMFASSYIRELSKSDLLENIYYYHEFSVRVNGIGVLSPISFTNDFDRYLIDDYTVDYADGYDGSVFDGTGPVCLVGQSLAEKLGVHPGDDITLMSENLYTFMPQLYEEDKLEEAIARAGKPYKVAGILRSKNTDTNAGIFASMNEAAENLYSQPFAVDYCEFTLAHNEKGPEVNDLLEELKNKSIRFSPMAYFHVDSELFENTKRIRNLLESFFPIAVAAAVLIGVFGSGLILMQSIQEAAFLRILGLTKKRVRSILVFEQMILCIVGIVFVAGILILFYPGIFIKSINTLAFCWLLYLLGCTCGAFAASIQVTRHRVLELLQVKE